jgi:hypothetical protein
MSEKIYGLLLRLLPARFRDAYGDDALQLFRDRARDERGFFRGARLWLDLLADLAISIPREYGYAEPELLSASTRGLEGVPSFYVLRNEAPRLGALFLGGLLSVTSLAVFSVFLSQVKSYTARSGRASTASSEWRSDSKAAPGHATQPDAQEAASSNTTDQAVQSVSGSGSGTGSGSGNLDPAQRKRVIDAAVANLREHYAYPEAGQKMAGALLMHERDGDDETATDGAAFAALVTKQMRDVSADRHLSLDYFADPLPEKTAGPTPEAAARYRKAMKEQNCTFEKVETLPHNVGYVKFNWFPDLSVCQATASAAMDSLNHADAVIFDLRDNRGGEPATVAFMAAYLFDHPEYWYNPRENTTAESWTHSPVAGNLLADKPVYVLTSGRTFSGAEQFCYDLKMLKRATLVGETTGGGAHSGVFHRIDEHFGMGIPEVKAINPYSKFDWAEVGVEPDVKVKAADALQVAQKLAQGRLERK